MTFVEVSSESGERAETRKPARRKLILSLRSNEVGVEPTAEKINALKEASHALLMARRQFDIDNI